MPALYVHVPFCEKKCLYCDFASLPRTAWNDRVLNEYLEALFLETDDTISALGEEKRRAGSLYFGGGTPSLLGSHRIAALMTHLERLFCIDPGAEITLEMNPGTVDKEMLRAFRQEGITRASIGAQSFSGQHLQSLGRIHDRDAIYSTFEKSRLVGFTNISIDAIYAIPGQSLDDWEHDLDELLKLGPEHISAYSLIPEKGTPLGDGIMDGSITGADEDLQVAMQELAGEKLGRGGYRHYEISNYALPGRECVHNLAYWNYDDYLGFGAAACSFMNRWRYGNVRDPFEYMRRVGQARKPLLFAERLSVRKQMGEFMMLALRKAEGMTSARFLELFGTPVEEVFPEEIEELCEKEYLAKSRSGDGYRLFIPERHLVLHNEIAAAFIEA